MEKRNDFTAPVLLIDSLQIPLGHRLSDQVVSDFATLCYKERVDEEKALQLVDVSKLKEARKIYFKAFVQEFKRVIEEAKELGFMDKSERKPLSPEMEEYFKSIDFSKMKKPEYNDW